MAGHFPNRVSAEELTRFVRDVLVRTGLQDDSAQTVAAALVLSDARGVETHGVSMLKRYADGLRTRALNPEAKVGVIEDFGSILHFDGDNGLGQLAADTAMRGAIHAASRHGIGIATVRNANHAGALATYTLLAAEHDMIGFFTTNGPAVMAPWGGRAPVLCNNPLSYAVPSPLGWPLALDIAMTVAARGKLRLAALRGEVIPSDWAVDVDGRATTDPHRGLAGVLLPVGAHKGSGLAIMNEILAGVLSGARVGLEVPRGLVASGGTSPRHDSWRAGYFMWAMSLDPFGGVRAIKDRVGDLIDMIRSCEPAPGHDRVLLPGEIENERREERLARGIPLNPDVRGDLGALAVELRVETPMEFRSD